MPGNSERPSKSTPPPQRLILGLPLEEAPKGPLARRSLSQELPIAASTSKCRPDPPTRDAPSEDPSTARHLEIALPALGSLYNGELITDSPPQDTQASGSPAGGPLMAEGPSRNPVVEGISNNTSSIKEPSNNICSR